MHGRRPRWAIAGERPVPPGPLSLGWRARSPGTAPPPKRACPARVELCPLCMRPGAGAAPQWARRPVFRALCGPRQPGAPT
eukprot:11192748-Lingulodinium_polyedra.AAC.1